MSSNTLTVSNTAANPGGALMTTGSTSLGNVTLNNVNSVLAGGGSGSLTATLATGMGVGAFTQSNITLTYGDASTYSGALSNVGTTAVTITGNVLDHSNPALSVASGDNLSLFVNTAGTAALSLSNIGTHLSPLDVNTLSSGLSGSTGTAVIASGGSGTYVATLSTAAAGLSQSQSFSLKAGDQQSLSGASALGTLTQSVSGLNVYNHAAGVLSGGTTLTIPSVIVGYGSSQSSNTLTVSNTAANPGGALMTTGSTSLGNVTLNNVNNVLAGGGSGPLTATLATGKAAGAFTQSNITLTYADASTYSGALSNVGTTTVTITGNVLNHSNPALSLVSGNNQSLFVNTAGTASLSLTNSGTNLSPLDVNTLSSGLSGGTGTAVIASGGSATYTATLNTGTAGLSQTQSFSLKAGDEQDLLGASSLGTLTRSVSGLNVYNHAAGAISGGTLTLPTVIVGYGSSQSSNTLAVSNTAASPGGALLTTGTTSLSHVTLNNVNNVLAGGGSGSLTATLATGLGAGAFTNDLALTYGDASTYSGALSNVGTTALTITGDVLGHSNPVLGLASGNNLSVFLNASGTASLSLTDSGTNLSPLDVNTLSAGLSGGTGTAVIASGGSGAYTATLSTGTVGLSQSQSFSLKAGDQQSLSGASALGTLTQSVTGLNVYRHAAGALSGGTTLTIPRTIVGYASSVNSSTLKVSNTAASPAAALMTTGSTSLANVTLNNVGNVAASGSGSISATLATGQGVGAFTQSNIALTYADASAYIGGPEQFGHGRRDDHGQRRGQPHGDRHGGDGPAGDPRADGQRRLEL